MVLQITIVGCFVHTGIQICTSTFSTYNVDIGISAGSNDHNSKPPLLYNILKLDNVDKVPEKELTATRN